MYISKVTLGNVRGFTDLNFDLTRPGGGFAGWTVFTGDNGSGKSTLLKAIAVGLTGKDTARALQPSFHRWIREGQHEAFVELGLMPVTEDDYFSEGGRVTDKAFLARMAFRNGHKEPQIEAALPSGVSRKNYSTPQRSIWSLDAKGWFSCGYGPFRRVFGASPEATRQMVAPSTERFVTMFQEAASLAEVDQWLRTLSHRSLEAKSDAREQMDLILAALRDELMPNQITVDRIDSDGLWLKDRNGLQLSWSEMSDGYRAALALLADILRHLINAYGVANIADRDDDGKLVFRRSGVVLIDEIDAHLHPEWQREIGFWLKRHFPNIQFLVTTHSPIICQAADPNGLFVLPEPGSGNEPHPLSETEYRKVITSRPDTILLTSAFGLQNTRSPQAVEARAQYARIKAKERSGAKLSRDDRQQLQQLQLFARADEEL
ncbi:MAG: AAA family ATPase [Rhodocyclaceae bacterium]|nr:AAA family ATPase [Rhodocyclaceae bacterium]